MNLILIDYFVFFAKRMKSIDNVTQATIDPTIGQAFFAGTNDSNVPTNAPIEKRIVPANEETVPAMCG